MDSAITLMTSHTTSDNGSKASRDMFHRAVLHGACNRVQMARRGGNSLAFILPWRVFFSHSLPLLWRHFVKGNGKRMAILSLMDPTFVHAGNPKYANKTIDYERALDTELTVLRRVARPEVVVAMINSIPTSDAAIAKAGSISTAKLNAIDALIHKTIGVDVYILSSFSEERAEAGSYTTTNWIGDAVLVVPLRTNSQLGKTVEVVKVALDSEGLLHSEFSGSHAIELTCSVPENKTVRAMVDAQEALREQDMSVAVATISNEIWGLEVYGSDDVDDNIAFASTFGRGCVKLVNNGTTVGKCGCRVSQCAPGSLIADAMRYDSGADFAVSNSGGLRAGLQSGEVSRAQVHQMLPFLNDVVQIDNVLGSTVKEMLLNSVSRLNDPGVTTTPDGRYLQVSKSIRFDWYFEGLTVKIGLVEVCRNSDIGEPQTLCNRDSDFRLVEDDSTYRVAVPGFIASGGDDYIMLVDGYAGHAHTPLHKSQYEVVVDYFQSDYTFLTAKFDENVPIAPIDLEAEHSRYMKDDRGSTLNYEYRCVVDGQPSSQGQRACQTADVVSIPFGMFCGVGNLGDLQECDQVHHMVEIINNKHDGFMDDLLPHARLKLHEDHVQLGCSQSKGRAAHFEMGVEANKAGRDRMFVAAIGPQCSSDVTDLSSKEWRAESPNNDYFLISHSSTSSTLADEDKYPNLARMVTSEKEISKGFGELCKMYKWSRVAIVHDSSAWGSDAAKQFEAEMLRSKGTPELLYMDFGEDTLDRSGCNNIDFPEKAEGDFSRVENFESACMPVTSFNVEKAYKGYANRGDTDAMDKETCDPKDSEHFCMDEIIDRLKAVDAKIIFVAMQQEHQRALFRRIYQRQLSETTPALMGKGYAWLSAWCGALF
jgi:hypothetical protein